MIQGSEEWLKARLGKLTASCIADAVAKTKTGWGASRANLMARLIVERLTGVVQDGYVNKEMEWGKEKEPEAITAYEFHRDLDVVPVGFVDHPRIEESGASPDGLIGDDGLIECKCPNSATHIDTLLGDPVPQKYLFQMQWQMACTERAWCDWVSYDPRMPLDLQLHVRRIARNNELIAILEKDAQLFLREMETKLATLRGRLPARAA